MNIKKIAHLLTITAAFTSVVNAMELNEGIKILLKQAHDNEKRKQRALIDYLKVKQAYDAEDEKLIAANRALMARHFFTNDDRDNNPMPRYPIQRFFREEYSLDHLDKKSEEKQQSLLEMPDLKKEMVPELKEVDLSNLWKKSK